jgi:transcriptional regulator PpsR
MGKIVHMIGSITPRPIADNRVRETAVAQFVSPEASFSTLDPKSVSALIASAGDVSLVVDADGFVRDVAFGSVDLAESWGTTWIGRSWVDTVTIESRPKIESLLADATADHPPRWRHVNHVGDGSGDVPVQYAAVRMGAGNSILAIGRDLRPVAALQQRLVAAQQATEREYARLRQMDVRHRLLLDATTEAVLIVDASTFKVVEANPAAVGLLVESLDRVVGRSLMEAFDPVGGEAVQTMLASVRATGRSAETRATPDRGDHGYRVSAALFRQDGVPLFMIRLVSSATDGHGGPIATGGLGEVLDRLPDGLVVTDADGRVQDANPAFVDMVQLASIEQARGQSLETWLGRPGVDLGVLIANLRQHGSVRLYATTLRGAFGGSSEIEVSAATVSAGDRPGIAFVMRGIGRRMAVDGTPPELPRSASQLKELVGRVPLKDLVRETTDVIEQLCIEAALEITGDNRASAAEILGLSRQSLYVKLRRYGLGDIEVE